MGKLAWTPAGCGVLLFIVHLALPATYLPVIILHAWPIHLRTQENTFAWSDIHAWATKDNLNRLQADDDFHQYSVDLFFYLDDPASNLLVPQKIQQIKSLERSIESLPGFEKYCMKDSSSSSPSTSAACLHRYSVLNYIYPSVRWGSGGDGIVPDVVADGEGEELQPILSVLTELQRLGVFWYTAKTFPMDLQSSIVRTRYQFANVGETDGHEFSVGYKEFVRSELYPLLLSISRQKEFNMNVDWESEELGGCEGELNLFHDLSLLAGSVVVVFVGMLLYSRSPFIAVNGILATLSSVPLTYITDVLVFGNQTVKVLNCVVVFVVLAVGTEGVYMCHDTFQEAKITRGQQEFHVCFGYAARRFAWKLFVASGASIAAFLTCIASPLASLRSLGLFAALAISFNCLCLLAVLPPAFIVITSKQLEDNGSKEGFKRETRTFFVDGDHQISKQAATGFVVVDEAEKTTFRLKSTSGYSWASRKFHNDVAAYMWESRRFLICIDLVFGCAVFAIGFSLVQHGIADGSWLYSTHSTALELSRKYYGSYGLDTLDGKYDLSLPLCSDALGKKVVCTHVPTSQPTVAPSQHPSAFHIEAPASSQPTAGPSYPTSESPSASTIVMAEPTASPTRSPSLYPSWQPTPEPTTMPSTFPTSAPFECPCPGYSYCEATTGSFLNCTCLPGWTKESNCTKLDEAFDRLPDALTETLTFAWIERDMVSSNWTAIQMEALQFCNDLALVTHSMEDLWFRRVEGCPIEEFATTWLRSKGMAFPIQNKEILGRELYEFTKLRLPLKQLLVVDSNKIPLLIAVDVKTGIDSSIDSYSGLRILSAWKEYARRHARLAEQTSPLWTRLETERSLVHWSIQTISFIATCTFVSALIGCKGNMFICSSVLLTFCLTVGCCFGWLVLVLRKAFTVESAVAVIFSAVLAINPSIHIATSVIESKRVSSYCRVRDALKSTGSPLLASAATILLATIPVMFGKSPFVSSFATVIASIIALRTFFAIAFLPPLLMSLSKGGSCTKSAHAKVVGNQKGREDKTTTASSVDVEMKVESRQEPDR